MRLNMKRVNVKRSFNNATANWNLVKLTKYFLIISAVLALASVWVWYTRVYMTPERRFWMAVDNSMSTSSVVRTLTEGGSGNTVVQDYRFHYSPQQAIENRVDFTQKSSTVDTKVVTEGIIFPQDQYLRYTEFYNKTSDSESANLDKLLGVWASQASEDEEEARLNYLSEYVTLVVFGNFNARQRTELMNSVKSNNVYNVDFANAIEDNINGESVYRYSVRVNLRPFAELLNTAFIEAGYGDFPPLNPENYREGSELSSSIAVRKRDNSIIGINYGNRDEKYSNYGVIKNIEAPNADMTIDELQAKVQEIIL